MIMAIALLFGVTACEQEVIPATTQETSQPQTMIQVPANYTPLLDAIKTFGVQSRSPLFTDLGFKKDELTGNYSVDVSKFESQMSDDSPLEQVVDELDNILLENPEFAWFGEFLDADTFVEIEETDIDFRGKKRYCCTVCCSSIVYKKSKRKRRWAARLWCSLSEILFSIMNPHTDCIRSLIEGHCIEDSCT